MDWLSLPWFIRSKTINLVIDANSEYSVLSKEWLLQVVKRLGKIVIMDDPPLHRRELPLRQYIEHLDIHRENDIGWNSICFDNIKRLGIYIYPSDLCEYDKFKQMLLRFPPLRELNIDVPLSVKLDYSQLLSNSQNQLEKLQMTNCLPEFYPSDIFFPKLKKLQLLNTPLPMNLQYHIKSMPSLKKLELVTRIEINSDPIPNITVLDLYVGLDKSYKFDLSLFPGLKKLTTHHEFTSESSHVNTIEDLKITVSINTSDKLFKIEYTKLKILYLQIKGLEFNFLNALLHQVAAMKKLTNFALSTNSDFNFPIQLPEETFSFTTLSLKGPFYLDLDTLNWFSRCSKLEHLLLNRCRFNSSVKRKAVPFKNLKDVALVSEATSTQFYKYFAKNCPWLDIKTLEQEPQEEF